MKTESPGVAFVDASEIPENVWRAIDYLASRVKEHPAPGMVLPVDHPLAEYFVTRLAILFGRIGVAISTDGRHYILQPASDRSDN